MDKSVVAFIITKLVDEVNWHIDEEGLTALGVIYDSEIAEINDAIASLGINDCRIVVQSDD